MKIDYLQFRKALERTGKTYFTFYDLKKFYPSAYESLKVLLSLWMKKKLINHLARGFYTFDIIKVDELKLANEFDKTSYLSFEYALYFHNLIDQVPQVITLATKKRHKIIKADRWTFEYTHLKKDLFFGYEFKNKVYVALPEKALADLVYLIARGKRTADLNTLEKRKINQKLLRKILKKFPAYTIEKMKELGILKN